MLLCFLHVYPYIKVATDDLHEPIATCISLSSKLYLLFTGAHLHNEGGKINEVSCGADGMCINSLSFLCL